MAHNKISFGTVQTSIPETLDDYEQAKIWLEGIGIKINQSRFQKYSKTIQREILDRRYRQTLTIDQNTLWAVAELHDLLDIHEQLKHLRPEHIHQALMKIKKGPELLGSEPLDGGGIHGRNFTFELYAAARFIRAGLNVSYQSEADINLRISDILLHVECKRVNSEKNLDNLIKDALGQVNKRCGDNSSDRGIVVLSLSKLIWKGQNESQVELSTDDKELRKSINPWVLETGLSIYRRHALRSGKAIGVVIHYKIPYFRKNGFPGLISRFSFIPFAEAGTSDKVLSDEFSACLENSTYRESKRSLLSKLRECIVQFCRNRY